MPLVKGAKAHFSTIQMHDPSWSCILLSLSPYSSKLPKLLCFLSERRQKTRPLSYIHICCGSYYLVQVWPFERLLSGPSLFFEKHCLSKSTIKIGYQHILFENKVARKNFKGKYLVQVGHFKSAELRQDNNPYLDQIITPQNIVFELKAEIPMLTVLF